MNQYPAVGDTCIPGTVSWCQEMPGFYAQKGVHVFCGQVRASADLYFCPATGDPGWPGYDPCLFSFFCFDFGFSQGEEVVFDIVAGPYAPRASNVQTLYVIEDFAAVAMRLAERAGRHADAAAQIREMSAGLYKNDERNLDEIISSVKAATL